MKEAWGAAFDETGLAWDDTSNNRAFLAGTISATNNGASAWWVARKDKSPFFDDIGLDLMPAGPKGQFLFGGGDYYAIMKYSKNVKLAKDFLRWLQKKENYEKWFQTQGGYSVGATKVWEKNPMWSTVDKPLQIFRTAARSTRIFGHAGPATAKATEAFSKYVVTDMYAKAVQGDSPEAAVAWAENELKQIYT